MAVRTGTRSHLPCNVPGYAPRTSGNISTVDGMSLHVPAGAERRALQQFMVDRYGGKANVVSPMIAETGRAIQPPGWTEWYGSLDLTTYCTYNTVFSVDGRPTLFHSSGQALDPDHLPSPLPLGGAANYQTDVIRDLSLRFLDRHGPSPDPLFLSISTLVPHMESCDWGYARLRDVGPLPTGALGPFFGNLQSTRAGRAGLSRALSGDGSPGTGDLRHLERFRRLASAYLGSSPSFDEADVSDKPSFIRSIALSMREPYADAPDGSPGDRYPYFLDPGLFPVPPAVFNRDISLTNPREQAIDQFARMVAAMGAFDRLIGAIAERLEARAASRILFSSSPATMATRTAITG